MCVSGVDGQGKHAREHVFAYPLQVEDAGKIILNMQAHIRITEVESITKQNTLTLSSVNQQTP
jgi:hypothetical protein